MRARTTLQGANSPKLAQLEIGKLTGSGYSFPYHAVPFEANDQCIRRYCTSTRRQAAALAKGFDSKKNTEWITRTYFAVKFILASTVILNSAKHAEWNNLQIALPYLRYYGLLNCCRAFLFTVPDLTWKGSLTVEMTHQKILNLTADYLKRIHPGPDDKWKALFSRAREQRELFSYSFPATAMRYLGESAVGTDEIIEACAFLSELCQLNTECVVAALGKYAPGPYGLEDVEEARLAVYHDLNPEAVPDDDDYHRLGRLFRKHPSPQTIQVTATEGLIEDYFGAWRAEESKAGAFDPCQNTSLLFPEW